MLSIRLLLPIFFAFSLLGGCASNTAEARAEARRDIRRGDLELRIYGESWSAEAEYARLLKDRLGVNLRRVGSCTIPRPLWEAADAYNDVVRQEIETQHGKGVLEALQAEAERLAQTTRAGK